MILGFPFFAYETLEKLQWRYRSDRKGKEMEAYNPQLPS